MTPGVSLSQSIGFVVLFCIVLGWAAAIVTCVVSIARDIEDVRNRLDRLLAEKEKDREEAE